jgi:hypothetical protein
MYLAILIIAGIFIYYYLKKREYDKSNYKRESGNRFLGVITDKEKYRQYLFFNNLEKIYGEHKILMNVYLPKEDGETTKADLVYINKTGVYVLESKNYSGWIFGDEKSEYWTQNLANDKKEQFNNPILQNNARIKYLRKVLKLEYINIKSIVVFSDRCTLKKLNVNDENVKIIKRDALVRTIKSMMETSTITLSLENINRIYCILKNYTDTNASEEVKANHVKI